jgi:DNA-binding response OmpR family regulator
MKKILVIEDERDIARLVKFSLEKNGFKVVVVTDGDEAPDVALKEKPDLILLDVMLPGRNGYEVCKMIKEKKELAHIPIIMLSARTQKAEIKAGLEAGALDYICKPFTPKELVSQVRRYLT